VTLADWAEQHGVQLEFIKPGKPMQNGFIERFNRSYREAVEGLDNRKERVMLHYHDVLAWFRTR